MKLWILGWAAAVMVCVQAVQADVILDATLDEDTWISSSTGGTPVEKSTAQVNRGNIYAGRDASSATRGGLLQFTLPVLPAGQKIKSVSLVAQAQSTIDNDTIQLGAVIGTLPNLNTLTWDSAIMNNLITGITATGNNIAWVDSNILIFAGENWTITAAAGDTVIYTDSTPEDGLLKFVNDNISTLSGVTIMLVTGPTGGQNATNVEFTSSERSTPVGGKAPFGMRMLIVIPEPASLAVVAGPIALLGRRTSRRERSN